MSEPLTVTEVRREGRSFTLTCQHPQLLIPPTLVQLPAHVAKQIVGLLIADEGQNEGKQSQTRAIISAS